MVGGGWAECEVVVGASPGQSVSSEVDAGAGDRPGIRDKRYGIRLSSRSLQAPVMPPNSVDRPRKRASGP